MAYLVAFSAYEDTLANLETLLGLYLGPYPGATFHEIEIDRPNWAPVASLVRGWQISGPSVEEVSGMILPPSELRAAVSDSLPMALWELSGRFPDTLQKVKYPPKTVYDHLLDD